MSTEIAKMTAGDERPGKGGRGEYVVDVKFPSKHRAHTEVNMSFDSTTIFAFLACALPILVIVSVSCCIVDPVLVSKLTLKSGTRTSTWRYVIIPVARLMIGELQPVIPTFL
jgi:hypothetical protein